MITNLDVEATDADARGQDFLRSPPGPEHDVVVLKDAQKS
jgi:hypothetical protein